MSKRFDLCLFEMLGKKEQQTVYVFPIELVLVL